MVYKLNVKADVEAPLNNFINNQEYHALTHTFQPANVKSSKYKVSLISYKLIRTISDATGRDKNSLIWS